MQILFSIWPTQVAAPRFSFYGCVMFLISIKNGRILQEKCERGCRNGVFSLFL